MIDWCKHNTDDTQAAMQLFQTKFASKVRVKNMTKETFLSTIGSSDFIPPNLFKAWTFEILEGSGQKLNATRFALNPLKIQQTMIGVTDRKDILLQSKQMRLRFVPYLTPILPSVRNSPIFLVKLQLFI